MLDCVLKAVPLAIAITFALEWALTPLKSKFHVWRHERARTQGLFVGV